MNIISFSILLCLTFRNCMTLAICSKCLQSLFITIMLLLRTCYSYAFLDQIRSDFIHLHTYLNY
jgi:hypothetical protein